MNKLQTDFPLTPKPFEAIGAQLGASEADVIERVGRLKQQGILRQISAIFDSRALGYTSTLVAMRIAPERLDAAAEIISRHSGVSHNYARDHAYNLWFTLTVPPGQDLQSEVEALAHQVEAQSARALPATKLFKIGVSFDMMDSDSAKPAASTAAALRETTPEPLTAEDIVLVQALQDDLPLDPRPFGILAERAGVTGEEILRRAQSLLERGVMRRFGAALRHRQAGFGANAMGVWVVPEERAEEVGRIMAGFDAVSHCYQRPTYLDWPYSLFTMIHGRSSRECEAVAKSISKATGITDYRLLYSTKEYKKVRVRYFE